MEKISRQSELEEIKQTIDIQAGEDIKVCYFLHCTYTSIAFKAKSVDPRILRNFLRLSITQSGQKQLTENTTLYWKDILELKLKKPIK